MLNAVDAVQELDSAAGGSIRIAVAVDASVGLSRIVVVDDGMAFEPAGCAPSSRAAGAAALPLLPAESARVRRQP